MGEWICTNVFSIPSGHTIEGITVDIDGMVYCASAIGNSSFSYLWKVSPHDTKSEPQLIQTKQSFHFGSIVWTPDNNLYIYDKISKSIFKYDINNDSFKLECGNRLEHPDLFDGKLNEARCISVGAMVLDNVGNIVFADHNCVRKIDLTQRTITTIAGIHSKFGRRRDGPVSTALFAPITGISVNKHGIIYVYHGSIGKIENGEVSTVKDGVLFVCGITFNDGSCLAASYGKLELHTPDGKYSYPSEISHITNIKVMTADRNGNVFAAGKNCIYQLADSWSYERFLWIGKLKEDSSYCILASLHVDTIREIASWMQISVTPSAKRSSETDSNTSSKKAKTSD